MEVPTPPGETLGVEVVNESEAAKNELSSDNYRHMTNLETATSKVGLRDLVIPKNLLISAKNPPGAYKDNH